jgi:hypothetical protein
MNSLDNAGFEPLSFTDTGVIALSILVFLCLFFAGRAVTGPKTLQAIQIFIGLLAVYVFFIIGSVFSAGFSVINALVFLILLSLIGVWRCKNSLVDDLISLAFSIAFVTPLLWLAVVMNNPQWDDYTNWLPSAQFLFKHGHLPTLQEPVINHATPSYPYSRAMLHTFVNLSMGSFIMNVQGVFNVLFASSLLLWAKPLIKIRQNNNENNLIILLSIMGVLSFSLIIWAITLNTRLIISSYADPIYSIYLTHLFLFLFISKFFENSFGNGKFNLILAGLFALPIIIKDVGIYHSIIILISYWIVFEVPKLFRFEQNLKTQLKVFITQASHILPMFLIKYIWDLYVNVHEIKTVFKINAIDHKKIELIPQILYAAEMQILGRPYILFAFYIMLLALLFSKPLNRQSMLAVLPILSFALVTALGIILFQLLAYLVTFGAYEAARAASFSRYIAPAGLITWTSVIFLFITCKWLSKDIPKIAAGILFSLILFSSIIFNGSQFNPASNVSTELKNTAEKIVQTYPKDEPLLIVDFGTNGIHAVIIRFYTYSQMPINYLASVHLNKPLNIEMLNDWLHDYKHIYIHSGSPKQISLIKQYLASRETKLSR